MTGKNSDLQTNKEDKVGRESIGNVEFKPLLYWNENDRNRKLETIESNMIALIRECDSLKSTLKQKEDAYKKNTKNLLLSLLGILDAFDRVFKNIESKGKDIDRQTKIWIGNFKSIRRLVEDILKEEGVVPVESPSGKAIPGFHTVIETRSMAGLEDDTIIEETEKGYLWHGEVLRKSSVIVSKHG